jgi:Flp pilus assembly protein TadD
MEFRKQLVQCFVFFLFLSCTVNIIQAQSLNNSISGMIFEAQGRQTVSGVYVELMNELGMSLRRIRVDSSGRFVFNGLSSGNFRVKVLTLGTNYREEVQEVSLVSIPRGGGRGSSDTIYVEFYLKLDPRKININNPGAATVVFAQDVPEAARKLYRKGVEQLEDKNDVGLETLKEAIDAFPTYYDALDRLGGEYVRRKQYGQAVPHLIKAIDVNQRSYTSFYALGIASFNLKDLNAASEALRGATMINPQSVNAQIFYGMLLRMRGNYELSEKALLQAKTIAKERPVAEVHWQLGLLYEKTARYDKAADELTRYLEIEKEAPNAEQIKKLIEQFRAKAK